MKTLSLGIVFSIAVMWPPTPTNAQVGLGNVILPYDVLGDGFIGTGVHINAPFSSAGECVTFTSLATDTNGAHTTRYETKVLSSFESLREETHLSLGFQSDAEVKFAGFSGDYDFKTTGKFGNILDQSSSSLVMMFSASADHGRDIALNYSLKDGKAQLLDEDPEKFTKQCGTHFIRAVRRVSDATVFVKITGMSETGKRTMEATLKNKFGGGFKLDSFSAGGDTTFTTEYKRIVDFVKRSSNIKVESFSRGGSGIGTVLSSLTDPTDLNAIGAAIAGSTTSFTRANSAPSEYILTSYSVFGAPDAPYDPQLQIKIGKLTEQLIRVNDAIKKVTKYKTEIPSTYSKYFTKTSSNLESLKSNLIQKIKACSAGEECKSVESDVLIDYVFLGDIFSRSELIASCSLQPASSLLQVNNLPNDPHILDTVSVNLTAQIPYYDTLDFSATKIYRLSPDFSIQNVTDSFGGFSIAPNADGKSHRLFGSLFASNLKSAETLSRDPLSNSLVVDMPELSDKREEILKSMFVVEVSGPGGSNYGLNLGYPDRENCKTLVR